jgi:hypothetical protein
MKDEDVDWKKLLLAYMREAEAAFRDAEWVVAVGVDKVPHLTDGERTILSNLIHEARATNDRTP